MVDHDERSDARLEPVPPLPSLDDLAERTEFKEPLLQASIEQWKGALRDIRRVEKLPASAVQMAAWQLPGSWGVAVNPFVRCPPGCEPSGGRGIVCPPVADPNVAFTPDPECWFEPQCTCPPEDPGAGVGGGGAIVPCDDRACRLRFTLVRFEGLRVAQLRLECQTTSRRRCWRCELGFTFDGRLFRIGCRCDC